MQGWGELVLQAPIRENGETVEPPDVTEEERREIENFDLRNYV